MRSGSWQKITTCFAVFFLLNLGAATTWAQLEVAEQMLAQHDFNKAFTLAQDALSRDPHNTRALLIGAQAATDGNLTVQFLQKALALVQTEKQVQDVLVLLGESYYARGNFAELLDLFEQTKSEHPEIVPPADFLFQAGLAAVALGRNDLAQRHFQSITKLFPRSDLARWARIGLADTYFGRGRFQEAIAQYKEVVKQVAGEYSPLAVEQLADSYLQINDTTRAELYFNLYTGKYEDGLGIVRLQNKLGLSQSLPKDTGTVLTEDRRWSLQAGVFGVLDNAQKQLARYQELGYPAELIGRVVSSRKFYVIYIGNYATEAEARLQKTEIESQMQIEDFLKVVYR